MTHLTLHEDPISANCYKVRLIAALASQPLEYRSYDIYKGETHTGEFTSKVSAYGQVPVLQIGESDFLAESNAICAYVAFSNPDANLIPADKLERAQMLQWMFFEQNQHEPTIAAYRAWLLHHGKDNFTESQRAQKVEMIDRGNRILQRMDDHLSTSKSGWFAGSSVTVADVVLYAYTHVANEAGFAMQKYPHVGQWLHKVEGLENFVAWKRS